jgi:phenylalanyl-tRNA synthetase beta chain
MLVTLNWLKEFVDFDLPLKEFCDKLTMMGLEVVSTKTVGINEALLSNVFFAKITDVKKHPKADKLFVCKVRADKKNYQVITNSPNVIKGCFIVFATPGTTLYDGTEIGERTIKDEVSQGMLLARQHLNLEEKSSDIWILGDDEKTAKEKFDVWAEFDVVIELDLTANRSDCLSVIGVAREVSAMTDTDLIVVKPVVQESLEGAPSIEIQDKNLCPRYASRVVKGITITQSPEWIKRKLELCGIRAINNVVDATNYVLLEYGHPTHAFDFARLDGGKIIVRKAMQDETITTLDGVKYKLSDDMLVIADENKPVALAGIMGGENSEVLESSTELLLESAYFEPTSIRKTAKSFGIRTESSYRFERTSDWGIPPIALDRVAEIIMQTTDGKVSALTDRYVNIFKDKIVNIKEAFVSSKLGIELHLKDVENYLKRLGFSIMVKRNDELEVKIPTYRSDVYRSIDLVEEIARIYGYNNIPLNYFRPKVDFESLIRGADIKEKIREILIGIGLSEAYNFSFTNEAGLELFKINDKNVIRLKNPLTRDATILRNHLFPGLVSSVQYNNKSSYRFDVRLFELGNVFKKLSRKGMHSETEHLCIAVSSADTGYGDCLGIVEYVMKKLGAVSFEVRKESQAFLHPQNSATIVYDGKSIGIIGELHPEIAEKTEMRYGVYIAEIEVASLEKILHNPVKISKAAKFPPILRDLSLVVGKEVQARSIMNYILSQGKWVKEVKFIDMFTGDKIGDDKKSITFSIVFQNPEKTMTDEEAGGIMNGLVSKIEKEFGAKLRGV